MNRFSDSICIKKADLIDGNCQKVEKGEVVEFRVFVYKPGTVYLPNGQLAPIKDLEHCFLSKVIVCNRENYIVKDKPLNFIVKGYIITGEDILNYKNRGFSWVKSNSIILKTEV